MPGARGKRKVSGRDRLFIPPGLSGAAMDSPGRNGFSADRTDLQQIDGGGWLQPDKSHVKEDPELPCLTR
ncbi:hypothetical protein GCM10027256_38130 [Novispirillum itersonii subsp. nipponicum]